MPASRQAAAAFQDTPIARPSLHDEVTARLRDLIVEGRLAPGALIPELDLARSLGISRTPLREALKVLATEGLVDLQPGRGASVKVVTAQDARDMLALTGLLEAHAGRLAAQAASDDEIAAIMALHRRMREHFERRERPEYFVLNQQVHDDIVRAAHSTTLSMLHGMLRLRMRRIRYIGNHSPQNWADAMAEHAGFGAALAARDGDRLATLLQAHMDNSWPRVSSSVTAPDAGL
jgi:DNA-binding GntR family transcriptional regulator